MDHNSDKGAANVATKADVGGVVGKEVEQRSAYQNVVGLLNIIASLA